MQTSDEPSVGTASAPGLDMTYIEHRRRLGRRPPVKEALTAIAARMESGGIGRLAYERRPAEVGAQGLRRSWQPRAAAAHEEDEHDGQA